MSLKTFAPALVLALLLAAPVAHAQTLCYAENDGPNYNDGISMGGPNLLLGIKFNPSVSFNVDQIEVFTGEGNGLNSVAIWTHDSAQNQPGTQLTVGSWSMSRTNSWQGAQLLAPAPIAAGTDYWMVWGCINGSQGSVDVINGPSGQVYRGSFDGGNSWNGPWQFNNRHWKFRLYGDCCTGAFRAYGTPCPGSGGLNPALAGGGCPSPGSTISLDVSQAQPTAAGLMFLGTGSGTVALGAGCDLQVLPVLPVLIPFGTTASGGISIPAQLPFGTAGLDLYLQALLLDAGVGLGFSGTNGLQVSIR